MFTHIMERNTPEEHGDDLWTQCFNELVRIGQPFTVEDVNRLTLLASHDVYGDFKLIVEKVASDAVNGFVDGLPF